LLTNANGHIRITVKYVPLKGVTKSKVDENRPGLFGVTQTWYCNRAPQGTVPNLYSIMIKLECARLIINAQPNVAAMCHRPAAGQVQVVLVAMFAELPKLAVSQIARAWAVVLLLYVYALLADQLMV